MLFRSRLVIFILNNGGHRLLSWGLLFRLLARTGIYDSLAHLLNKETLCICWGSSLFQVCQKSENPLLLRIIAIREQAVAPVGRVQLESVDPLFVGLLTVSKLVRVAQQVTKFVEDAFLVVHDLCDIL